jgi:hypothetical protein
MRMIFATAAALAVLTVSGCDMQADASKPVQVACNCHQPPAAVHAHGGNAPPASHYRRHRHEYASDHGGRIVRDAGHAPHWNGGTHDWRDAYAERSIVTYDYHSHSQTYYDDGTTHDAHDDGYAGGADRGDHADRDTTGDHRGSHDDRSTDDDRHAGDNRDADHDRHHEGHDTDGDHHGDHDDRYAGGGDHDADIGHGRDHDEYDTAGDRHGAHDDRYAGGGDRDYGADHGGRRHGEHDADHYRDRDDRHGGRHGDDGFTRADGSWIDGYGRSHWTGGDVTRSEQPDETEARLDSWHGYDADCPDQDQDQDRR